MWGSFRIRRPPNANGPGGTSPSLNANRSCPSVHSFAGSGVLTGPLALATGPRGTTEFMETIAADTGRPDRPLETLW